MERKHRSLPPVGIMLGSRCGSRTAAAFCYRRAMAPGPPCRCGMSVLKAGQRRAAPTTFMNTPTQNLPATSSRLTAVQVQAVSNIMVAPEGDSRSARQIKSEIGLLEVLAWTRDGQIVYRSSAGGNGADIWIMKADGSNAKQLTVGARASRGL